MIATFHRRLHIRIASIALLIASTSAAPLLAQSMDWFPSPVLAQQMGGRNDGAMVYDRARQQMLVYGGHIHFTYRSDMWWWNGQTWTQVQQQHPPARAFHAMAYDAARERVVMFGGSSNDDRTWLWDGASWEARQAPGPGGRGNHGMVFDSARQRIVLFGGQDSSGRRGDTWEWDGDQWMLAAQTGPAPRAAMAMAYDDIRAETVLFGGRTASGTSAETWVWNEAEWSQRHTIGPPAREDAQMAMDSARGRMVLYGGRSLGHHMADTWAPACPTAPHSARHAESAPKPRHSPPAHTTHSSKTPDTPSCISGQEHRPDAARHLPPHHLTTSPLSSLLVHRSSYPSLFAYHLPAMNVQRSSIALVFSIHAEGSSCLISFK